MQRRTRTAFTLVELAIVLGVIGLILGGVWQAYASLQDRMKVNKAIQQLQFITTNMRSLYAEVGQTNLAPGNLSDQTARLVRARIFPQDMIVPGQPYPQGPWGGVVIQFNSNAPDADQARTYQVSFHDVVNPAAVTINSTTRTVPCEQLMTAASRSARALGLQQVYNFGAEPNGDGWMAADNLSPDDIADCRGPVFFLFSFR